MEKLIRAMIARGEVLEAVNTLIELLPEGELSNEMVLHSSRLVSARRNLRMNLISREEAERTKAQVAHALVSAMEEAKSTGELEEAPPSLHPGEVRKILFAEANPFPDVNLLSGQEYRELDQLFRHHPHAARFELQGEFAVSPGNLEKALSQEVPWMLHVSAFANEEGIFLHAEDYAPRLVDNEAVLALFDRLTQLPECVFFNTWVSETMAERLSRKIPFVIGINALIKSTAAIAFATGFYQALAFEKDFPTAFETGIRMLDAEGYSDEREKPFMCK